MNDNKTRKFAREDLLSMVYGDAPDEYTKISDEITDTTRWSVLHSMIFKYGDRYYLTHYSVGATEYQDEQPFDDNADLDDNVECFEVTPVETVTYEYRPVKEDQ